MSTRRQGTGFTRSEKSFITLSGLFVLLLFALGAWWQMLNSDPSVQIPQPRMPQPNAFDDYRAAGAILVSGRQIRDALLTETERQRYGNRRFAPRPYSLAEKESILVTNEEVLFRLRQGLNRQYYQVPAGFDIGFPVFYLEFRYLSSLLRLEAQVHAAHRNWPGSAGSSLDAIQFGRSLTRGANLSGYFIGVTAQSNGRAELWTSLLHLNAPQTRAALARLQAILEQGDPLVEVLQNEKRNGQMALLELFAAPGWRNAVMNRISNAGRPGDWLLKARLIGTSKKAVMAVYSEAMDAQIANARLPYPYQQHNLTVPSDPVISILYYPRGYEIFRATHNETQNALLLTSLALRTYYLEHGYYPPQLVNLVPSHLKHLPLDPFTAGQPLHYKPMRAFYRLYSIGPDGQDDNGQAIGQSTSATVRDSALSAAAYAVQPQSKGDIVAGMNTSGQ